MNPKNFGVDMTNGFVCAFDTDSFHLYNRNLRKWYPCTVLDSHYIAPELQERFQKGARVDSFRPEKTFTTETDRFALAILIFQLLFNGTHPFTAARVPNRGSSVIVHSRVTNIYQRMCPYFNPSYNVTLPRYAPPLDIVPSNIQNAFRKAFLENIRPQASEWVEMLDLLRHQLVKCQNGHFYGKYNSGCPWCKKETAASAAIPGSVTATRCAPTSEPVSASKPVAASTTTQLKSNPIQGQNQISNGPYHIKKYRAWYAHEIVNLLAWIPVLVLPPEEESKLTICIIVFCIALIARGAKRKNETLPTGGGAKFMAWLNIIFGGCLLIGYIICVLEEKQSPTSADDTKMFILGCEMIIYGLCSLKDVKS